MLILEEILNSRLNFFSAKIVVLPVVVIQVFTLLVLQLFSLILLNFCYQD